VRAQYPFDSHYLAVGGGRLHYVVRGPEDGRPVLLLHGNPTWSYLYRKVIPGLAASRCRVYALDHVGFGRSEQPADPACYTFQRQAANVREFVDALGLDGLVVVGHEWGGPIGMQLAVDQPSRVAAQVWLNTSPMVDVRLPLVLRLARAPVVGELLFRRWNLYVEALLPYGVVRRAALDDVVMDAYREPFPTPASRAAILAFLRMVPQRPAHPARPVLEALAEGLRGVRVPALVIGSREDPAFGVPAARALHARLPVAELALFSGAGHYLQEDIPEKLVATISRFLDEQRR
jgi:haloalkane dehalogenase